MGMYDTVLVRCPQCGTPAGFQSKSGSCSLKTYTLDEAPDDVLSDVNRHAPAHCEKCGALFGVEIEGPHPQRTLGAHSKIWEAPDEDKEICGALSSSGDGHALSLSDVGHASPSSGDEHALSSSGDEHALSSSGDEHALSSSGDEHALSSSGDEHALSLSDVGHASPLSSDEHTSAREFVQESGMEPHETELHCAGSYYGWSCTCGKSSRHLAPLHQAIRNAQAHERKAPRAEMPRAIVKKLPRVFQGAEIVRGLGMNSDKLDALVERTALDSFDGSRDMWLVIENSALEDRSGFCEVRGFTDKAIAVRYAQALSNGNVDHRVLRVTKQVLVVATENEL
jgi:hypothetical protein